MDRSVFLLDSAFQLSPVPSINLTKMKNKDYYWLLINRKATVLKANSKWERDLQIDQTFLTSILSRVKKVCKDNKLREFYFKLLHRVVVSEKELLLFGKAEDSKCFYCKMNDSLIHTFCHYNWSQSFLSEGNKFLTEKMSPLLPSLHSN